MKRTPLRRISKKRAAASKGYTFVRAVFLNEHPICQVSIREAGIPEHVVVAAWRQIVENRGTEPEGGVRVFWEGKVIALPRSHQIHHRNKRTGTRLTDTRWFLAVCLVKHAEIEENKAWARSRGYLLDISADPDGFSPAGVQALTTEELMKTIDREQLGLLSQKRGIPDGDPCGHPGCLSHVTHKCEGCGRVAGVRQNNT